MKIKSTSSDSYFQKALILLFLAVIFIPPLKMLLSPRIPWSETEKRKLAEPPVIPTTALQASPFFSLVDEYLNDHFGYRDFFIRRYHYEMEKIFGKTGLHSKVILGKEGWYFYTAHNQIEDYKGKTLLRESQLHKWITTHNARAEWLRKLGIGYLLVAPPEKHAIYPEYLPEQIQKLKKTSRFEQLIISTRQSPLPYLINLHEPLTDAKKDQQLYYKADTHWNSRGGYVAFLAITKGLQELFHDVRFTIDFHFGPDIEKVCSAVPGHCDLARMVMQQEEVKEVFPTLAPFQQCAQPRSLHHYRLSNFTQLKGQPSQVRGCPQKELTAVVFHDSFFVAMKPFISENFRHVLYLWKEYDQKNLEEIFEVFTPDVVIEEVVERDFFEGY
jgi:hypothetical protein